MKYQTRPQKLISTFHFFSFPLLLLHFSSMNCVFFSFFFIDFLIPAFIARIWFSFSILGDDDDDYNNDLSVRTQTNNSKMKETKERKKITWYMQCSYTEFVCVFMVLLENTCVCKLQQSYQICEITKELMNIKIHPKRYICSVCNSLELVRFFFPFFSKRSPRITAQRRS